MTITELKLNWIKCVGDLWCDLLKLNLEHAHFNNLDGVYIIWHGAPNPKTVRVGQGNIKERLVAHRDDPEIKTYSASGLFVTWARVDSVHRDGVEKYLYDRLGPLIGERRPNVLPITVNLPW